MFKMQAFTFHLLACQNTNRVLFYLSQQVRVKWDGHNCIPNFIGKIFENYVCFLLHFHN